MKIKIGDLIFSYGGISIIILGLLLSIPFGYYILKPELPAWWGLLTIGMYFVFNISAFIGYYKSLLKNEDNKDILKKD